MDLVVPLWGSHLQLWCSIEDQHPAACVPWEHLSSTHTLVPAGIGALPQGAAKVRGRQCMLAAERSRVRLQELEGQHGDQKKAYDAAVASSSGRVAALEQEVQGLQSEVEGSESRLHWLGQAAALLEQQSQRIAKPAEFAATVSR